MRKTLRLGFVWVACAATLTIGCGEQSGASGDGGGGGNVGFGGAQDIGQFRGLLNDGQIPGPNTLDANGFFSEHRTELPAPDCGETICANGMLSVGRSWVSGEYQATLQVALNTPIDPATLERKPVNLMVVVDTSGSMQQDSRLEYVKEGLHLLIDELLPGDRLGVVTYSNNASIQRSLIAPADPEDLHQLVDTLIANGGTNIYDGLELGFSETIANLDLERQNRVVLLSDGEATAGIINDNEILNMAAGYIAEGIGLTTIGVGRSFNVDLMRGLAERGAGNFYFVESSSAVTEVFTEELNYFVTPLALSVAIDVEAASGYQLGSVTGTRLWKTNDVGGQVFLPAVFIASRTDDENPNGRRGGGSALFIDLESSQAVAGAAATITLSYLIPGATERTVQTITVENPLGSELGDDLYVSQAAMAEHYAVYNMYLGLHTATRHAEVGDYNCAVATLRDVRGEALTWNQDYADSDIAADIELVDQFRDNLVSAGADPNAIAQGCDQLSDFEGDDWGNEPVACSAAGGNGTQTTLIIALGLLLGLARRRKR